MNAKLSAPARAHLLLLLTLRTCASTAAVLLRASVLVIRGDLRYGDSVSLRVSSTVTYNSGEVEA